jgi:hypothetical protein
MVNKGLNSGAKAADRSPSAGIEMKNVSNYTFTLSILSQCRA